MADRRNDDAREESRTEIQPSSPDFVELVPIREGMVLAGRYAIERILGRGGSGVVLRAHDRDLKAAVAIKIVRAELAGQRMWADRLAREVRLARQINHPHICRVFDFEQADGRAFLVMELAERGTLRDELRSGSLWARPVSERIADARAVASALEAIHRAGIIHRDLSPQNMLRMADGRLVLSDFGLAVDTSDTTNSVYGGTVSYMAPEVLRGGKATYASDVWGLGVVMHEMVFGSKPRWSEGSDPVMLEPRLKRRLTREERAVFETCRACTALDPARRLVREGEVVRMLAEAPPSWRWRLRPLVAARRPVFWASLVTVLVALAAGLLRARHPVPDAPSSVAQQSPLISPTGEPADWTDISTVIAEVPGRILCTRLLPDRRTIRFVWGAPPRAEDIDILTRERAPSSLVPAAYAEGCPDLSPDGRHLVYQGHAPDGRAFAFLSERPDGKDAVPLVPAAEPSTGSEPTWLADSQTFSFDIDTKHMGAFSTALNRVKVLPDTSANLFGASFRSVLGNVIFVSTVSASVDTEFAGIAMPAMQEELRFRVHGFAIDLRSDGALRYYTSQGLGRPTSELIELDVPDRRARRIGRVRDQHIRYPAFTTDALTFVTINPATSLRLRGPDGTIHVSNASHVWTASRCGKDLVVAKDGAGRIERVDDDGRLIATLTDGPYDFDPGCSPDGRVVYYVQQKDPAGAMRCEERACKRIIDGAAMSLSVSPDGKRIALVTFGKRGPVVTVAASDGSGARELVETETACKAGWASTKTLWVSRRRNGAPVWLEIDADSARETGRSVPGSRDCSDARPDPMSPVQPEVRVVFQQTSQLRLLDRKFLR